MMPDDAARRTAARRTAVFGWALFAIGVGATVADAHYYFFGEGLFTAWALYLVALVLGLFAAALGRPLAGVVLVLASLLAGFGSCVYLIRGFMK